MQKQTKIFVLLITCIFVLGLANLSHALSPTTPCSIEEPCSENMQCVTFPDLGSVCVSNSIDPCSEYECPENTICLMAESYPAQLICSPISNPVVSENDIFAIISSDEDITPEDLGVKDPILLPDSHFYFFKNWGRGIRTFFTFNPVKKAELKLKYANEKIIEVKKLAEKTDKPEVLKKAMESYQKELNEIEEVSKKIKEKASENEAVGKFLDKFTQHQALHYRILQKLEDQVPEKALERIRETREVHIKNFGEVMIRLEDKSKIQERLEKNLEKVKGSKFKEFKNLEVLKELEDNIPEEAKEAVRKTRENTIIKLKEKAEDWSSKDQEEFKGYLEKISGGKEIQLEILENIKSEIGENAELRNRLYEVRKEFIRKIPTELIRKNCGKIELPSDEFCKRGRIIYERDEKGCIISFRCVILQPVSIQPTPDNRNKICIALWDPVCGKDGKTYSNKCYAELARAELDHAGVCKDEATTNQLRKLEPSIISPVKPMIAPAR